MNHARAVSGRGAWLAAALAFLGTGDAAASAPEPLHAHSPRVAVNSASGSGAFGRWGVDRFGLPVYRYTLDQARAPFARQPELLGSTQAFHQLGNGRAIAMASNDGFVQLWSQDRRYQWANRHQPDARHHSGGFGYLRTGRHRDQHPLSGPARRARARCASSASATRPGAPTPAE